MLKGVDGVVFVADSQRPMLEANIESLRNLEENLARDGACRSTTLPIVLQYNKRDLPDVAAGRRAQPRREPARLAPLRGLGGHRAGRVRDPQGDLEADADHPQEAPDQDVERLAAAGRRGAARRGAGGRRAGSRAAPAGAAPRARAAADAEPAHGPDRRRRRAGQGEVEPGRRAGRAREDPQAGALRNGRHAGRPSRAAAPGAGHRPVPPAPPHPAAARAATNGKGEIHRSVELTLKRSEYQRARRFLLNLRVEDGDHRVVDAIKDLPIEINEAGQLEKVLLQLNVALKPKD